MKKFVPTMILAALAAATSANAAVIINEVYPGGGSSAAGTTYTRDYVELYNTGTTLVDLSGYRLTYASSTGNFGTNNVVAFGAGSSIGAGDYLLLVTGGVGTAGVAIPNANYYAGTNSGASLSGTAGSVTLLNAANVQIDTVGYGTATTATDANGLIKIEGSTTTGGGAPAPTSNASSLSRLLFADTNVNAVDFTNQTPSPTAGTNSAVFVPEPTTLAAIAGLGLVGFARRRRA